MNPVLFTFSLAGILWGALVAIGWAVWLFSGAL